MQCPFRDSLKPDPRVKGWLFVDSPNFTISMVAIYLFISLYLGPKLMYNRKAFNLKKIMIFYNLFHAVISAYILIMGILYGRFERNNIFCYPPSNETTDEAIIYLYHAWLFYFTRYLEHIDTYLFILHKKFEHVSTLHVVHHVLVPIVSWIGVKYVPDGHYSVAPLINLFIHTVMYTYYMLAAMGPKMRKYLWWKKYLTILQLIQFFTIVSFMTITILLDCPVEKFVAYIAIVECGIFFYLFLKFYLAEYSNKPNKETTKSVPLFLKIDNYIYNKLHLKND